MTDPLPDEARRAMAEAALAEAQKLLRAQTSLVSSLRTERDRLAKAIERHQFERGQLNRNSQADANLDAALSDKGDPDA